MCERERCGEQKITFFALFPFDYCHLSLALTGFFGNQFNWLASNKRTDRQTAGQASVRSPFLVLIVLNDVSMLKNDQKFNCKFEFTNM